MGMPSENKMPPTTVGTACSFFGFQDIDKKTHFFQNSIYWMEKFGDPTWEGHKAVAQLYGLIAMQIAETPIIPFDFEAYADLLDVREIFPPFPLD